MLSQQNNPKVISLFKRNLEEEQVKSLESSLSAGTPFMKVYIEAVVKEIETKISESELTSNYTNIHDWAYFQADNLGYRRGLKKALELLGL